MRTLNKQLTHRLFLGTLITGLLLSSAALAKTSQEDVEWIEAMADIEALVKIYDKNHDQILSAHEVTQGAQYETQRSDTNRDGKTSLSEFERSWNNDMQQYARTEFTAVDTNQSQDITLDEIIQSYRTLEKRWLTPACDDQGDNQSSSDAELRLDATQELTIMDDNSDQRISYAEFSKTERREMVMDFQELDRNGDAQITTQEWQAGLYELAAEALLMKQELSAGC